MSSVANRRPSARKENVSPANEIPHQGPVLRSRTRAENSKAAGPSKSIIQPAKLQLPSTATRTISTSTLSRPAQTSTSTQAILPATAARTLSSTSARAQPSTSAQALSSTSARAQPSTSAQALSSTSARAQPSTSAQALSSTSARALPSTSARSLPSTSKGTTPASTPAAAGLPPKCHPRLGPTNEGPAARAIVKAKRTLKALEVPVAVPFPLAQPIVALSEVEVKAKQPKMMTIVEFESDDEELHAAMLESAQMANARSAAAQKRAEMLNQIHQPKVSKMAIELEEPKKEEEEGLRILLTFEDTTCSFCTAPLSVGQGVVLQDCYHAFCRTCIVTAVETAEGADIQCPMSPDCEGRIFEREIKALLTTAKYEEYCMKSVNQAFASLQNVFHCAAKNCPGVCTFEEGNKVFLCPYCNQSNCLKCKAIHEGLECEQYRDLVKASLESGKSLEEAQAVIVNNGANGWNQMVGTVAGWVATSSNIGANRKSMGYSKVFQQMANFDYLPNSQAFECPICYDTIDPGNGVIFQECFHLCCKECIVGLVENSDEPGVKCPYQDDNYSCICYLQPREIRALVSPQLYETHLARSVKLAENAMVNSFHCKTRDCLGWCEVEEGAIIFTCEICGKNNCLKCEAIHEGVNCEDYKNRLVQGENDLLSDAAVEDLIKKGKAMKCPRCKAVVVKTEGCDWIVCSLCKTEICWATKGPRWGPKGNGDTSGGCRCKVGGKLCTPKCGNCH